MTFASEVQRLPSPIAGIVLECLTDLTFCECCHGSQASSLRMDILVLDDKTEQPLAVDSDLVWLLATLPVRTNV